MRQDEKCLHLYMDILDRDRMPLIVGDLMPLLQKHCKKNQSNIQKNFNTIRLMKILASNHSSITQLRTQRKGEKHANSNSQPG